VVLLLLFGLVLLAVATGLAVRAAGHGRRQAVATLEDIGRYGFRATAGAEAPHERRPVLPRLDNLAGSLGTWVLRVGGLNEDELRRELRQAAIYRLTPGKLVGYRVLAGLGLPLFWLWVSVTGGSSAARTIIGMAIGLLGGWQGPLIYIRRRSRMRLEEIDLQMPELIDLLVTTVEAGVGFSGSLQIAAQRFQGPLGEELRLTLQEEDFGLSSTEALANLLERAPTPSMRSFVRAIVQGETLGVSIGKIMRDLADEMRKTRRQKAEERAQKAPTKMLFPLIFLIFPAMFVILLGPAIIDMIQAFKG
jgi:tight adherence protein C